MMGGGETISHRKRDSKPIPLTEDELYHDHDPINNNSNNNLNHQSGDTTINGSFDTTTVGGGDDDDEMEMSDREAYDDDDNRGIRSHQRRRRPTVRRTLQHSRSFSDLSMLVQEKVESVSRSSCFFKWFCRLLQLLNTFILLVLILIVMYLFEQVQTVKTTMVQDEKLIHDLKEQLNTQQKSQNHLNERVEAEHSFTLYQLAGTFTLLTCLITIFHITQHISNWNEPEIQRKILAILWMSPIYSITSWLSLVFVQAVGYLAILKDFYEAYVIYTFLSFLIAVLGRGNRNVAILVLSKNADHMKEPTRIFNKCYHPPPNESDQAKAAAILLECQIWAMQFVLLRPITSIGRFVLERMYEERELQNVTNGTYDETDTSNWSYFVSPFFAIDMVTNISVFFAFHGLLKFYHNVHHDLKWCQPFNKFMCIKGIVFLTFWQGLLISILCSINAEESALYNNNNNSAIHSNTSSSMNNNNNFKNNSKVRRQQQRYLNLNSFENEVDKIGDKTMDTLLNTTLGDFLDTMENNNDNSTGNSDQKELFIDLLNTTIFTNDTYYDDNILNNNNNDTLTTTNTNIDPNESNNLNHDDDPNNSNNNDEWKNYENHNKKDDDDPMRKAREQASKIQNFIICLEMLFFTIAHWCVFPTEEWKPDYRPQKYVKPGIGLKDFASDISYILSTSTSARAYNKQQRQQDQLYQQQQDDDGEVEQQQQQYQMESIEESTLVVTVDPSDTSFHDDNDDNDGNNDVNMVFYGDTQKASSSSPIRQLHHVIPHQQQQRDMEVRSTIDMEEDENHDNYDDIHLDHHKENIQHKQPGWRNHRSGTNDGGDGIFIDNGGDVTLGDHPSTKCKLPELT